MNQPALISVLIPAYNAERWIGAALESALRQSWPHIEVIVVDDGSTDDTLREARRFEQQGVRVMTQPNRGAAAARNRALDAARGDFIQYLDADDLLSPDKVTAQLKLLSSAPSSAVATCRWRRFSTTPDTAWEEQQLVYRDLEPMEFLLLMATKGAFVHPAAWLLPRAVVERAGRWNESLSLNDDGEYFARVALAAGAIRHCTVGHTYFRSYRQNTLSKRRDDAACDSQIRSADLISSLLLSVADNAQTQRACAALYLTSLVRIYPCKPELTHYAEERIRALGGADLRPRLGGRAISALAKVLGWKTAARLRRWLWSGHWYPALKRLRPRRAALAMRAQ